jgi:hypothetical protein
MHESQSGTGLDLNQLFNISRRNASDLMIKLECSRYFCLQSLFIFVLQVEINSQ